MKINEFKLLLESRHYEFVGLLAYLSDVDS